MNDYIILTDSCIDLTNEMAKQMNLMVVPLIVTVEGKDYHNYLDEREITNKDFYQLLREHKMTSTSQVNSQSFIDVMTPILESGKDILSISFSSALSGTYNGARIASEELRETFPNRKIFAIDSLCASMGQGLLVTYAARLKKAGKTIEELAQWIEENKTNFCHLFTVGDLNHLSRGGRLSSTKAFLGTILRVKPLLNVSLEGKLEQTDKARGRRSSLDMMIARMVATITNPKGQTVYISHGDCLEDAVYVKQQIMDLLPINDIIINYNGPVVGSHSGVGTLAIFYVGKDRYEKY
jgi:DegV family protein with EDD domain